MRPTFARHILAMLLVCLVSSLAVTPALGDAVGASVMELGGALFLVNQEHRVSKTYAPDDLVLPGVAVRKASLQENIYMRPEAAKALERLFDAALYDAGYTLYAASGYRSFGIQQLLFNEKVAEVGSKEKARRRVAPAGASEHQLGLAMDVQSPSLPNLNPAFGDTPEGKWVAENAHRFGFIIRYKTEWSDVTGIVSEPWHIRYVGTAHATAMYILDMPLETYVAYCGQLPAYAVEGASHPLLVALVGALSRGEAIETLDVLANATPGERAEALRIATMPMLQDGETYESVLWYAYPTPRPTAAPWVDDDEEFTLLPLGNE